MQTYHVLRKGGHRVGASDLSAQAGAFSNPNPSVSIPHWGNKKQGQSWPEQTPAQLVTAGSVSICYKGMKQGVGSNTS
jgi:hypothetical protein